MDTHGLDGLALVNCRNVTVSVRVGPNKFPAIDVPTGYAEKGEARSDTIQRCSQVRTTPLTPVRIRPVLMLA
ncbi:hypothetical protein [Enterobacter phage 01_vB_Eclo_IJM]|nr:hypothetical protein [Enterobacter phage 01_vB_Eclo_IJM]